MSSSRSGSRRWGRDEHCHDDAAAKRPRRRQKHLFLVMDDWENGYSIHKLDVDAFESGAGDHDHPGRLPKPSVLRVEAPVDRSPAIVAAMGSKIFLVTDRYNDEAPILIYDTETASLAIGPRPTPALLPLGFIFLVPVDQKLYALNPRRADLQCSFEVMSRDDGDGFRRPERWSVESVPAPMPLHKDELVTGYAVHPDGRTIFVSARNRSPPREVTWFFDTRRSVWTWHGDWLLPFQDQGCYVDELDAWVGLRRDGFLCSCAVPSRGEGAARPEWKLGKETLFREDPERHVGQPGALLTYMGSSRFCLVECAARQEVVTWVDAVNGEDGCVLHVTVFGLEYDKRGELQMTSHRHARSYLVSRYNGSFPAQMFWM
ncbi:hypothetical protein ACP70R_011031 [Stipagrostis hirtigluma subsp. patula]